VGGGGGGGGGEQGNSFEMNRTKKKTESQTLPLKGGADQIEDLGGEGGSLSLAVNTKKKGKQNLKTNSSPKNCSDSLCRIQ